MTKEDFYQWYGYKDAWPVYVQKLAESEALEAWGATTSVHRIIPPLQSPPRKKRKYLSILIP